MEGRYENDYPETPMEYAGVYYEDYSSGDLPSPDSAAPFRDGGARFLPGRGSLFVQCALEMS